MANWSDGWQAPRFEPLASAMADSHKQTGDKMAATKQRTQTDFLCLTISAGAGKEDDDRYRYNVNVQSDATDKSVRFSYWDSIKRHDDGIDQLDREGLLFAFWSWVQDAQAGEESFEDFTLTFGHDSDSISARRIHRACVTARERFNRLWHDDRTPEWALGQLAAEGIE